MAWLISEARVFASIEVAHGRRARMRGLLGRSGIQGALAIPSCHWVHTLGMRFPIDIAYVDANNVVIKTECMHQYRIGMPVPHARMVIEAEAGAFERWGLRVGDPLEIRDANPDHAH